MTICSCFHLSVKNSQGREKLKYEEKAANGDTGLEPAKGSECKPKVSAKQCWWRKDTEWNDTSECSGGTVCTYVCMQAYACGEGMRKEDKAKADKEVPEWGKEHATFCTVGN